MKAISNTIGTGNKNLSFSEVVDDNGNFIMTSSSFVDDNLGKDTYKDNSLVLNQTNKLKNSDILDTSGTSIFKLTTDKIYIVENTASTMPPLSSIYEFPYEYGRLYENKGYTYFAYYKDKSYIENNVYEEGPVYIHKEGYQNEYTYIFKDNVNIILSGYFTPEGDQFPKSLGLCYNFFTIKNNSPIIESYLLFSKPADSLSLNYTYNKENYDITSNLVDKYSFLPKHYINNYDIYNSLNKYYIGKCIIASPSSEYENNNFYIDNFQIDSENSEEWPDSQKSFNIDSDGKLSIALPEYSGAYINNDGLCVKCYENGGLQVGSFGLEVNCSVRGGLSTSSNGTYISYTSDSGINVDENGIRLNLLDSGGLGKNDMGTYINIQPNGGLVTNGGGISINCNDMGGIQNTSSGLSVKIKSEGGLDVSSDGLFVKNSSGTVPVDYLMTTTPNGSSVGDKQSFVDLLNNTYCTLSSIAGNNIFYETSPYDTINPISTFLKINDVDFYKSINIIYPSTTYTKEDVDYYINNEINIKKDGNLFYGYINDSAYSYIAYLSFLNDMNYQDAIAKDITYTIDYNSTSYIYNMTITNINLSKSKKTLSTEYSSNSAGFSYYEYDNTSGIFPFGKILKNNVSSVDTFNDYNINKTILFSDNPESCKIIVNFNKLQKLSKEDTELSPIDFKLFFKLEHSGYYAVENKLDSSTSNSMNILLKPSIFISNMSQVNDMFIFKYNTLELVNNHSTFIYDNTATTNDISKIKRDEMYSSDLKENATYFIMDEYKLVLDDTKMSKYYSGTGVKYTSDTKIISFTKSFNFTIDLSKLKNEAFVYVIRGINNLLQDEETIKNLPIGNETNFKLHTLPKATNENDGLKHISLVRLSNISQEQPTIPGTINVETLDLTKSTFEKVYKKDTYNEMLNLTDKFLFRVSRPKSLFVKELIKDNKLSVTGCIQQLTNLI